MIQANLQTLKIQKIYQERVYKLNKQILENFKNHERKKRYKEN